MLLLVPSVLLVANLQRERTHQHLDLTCRRRYCGLQHLINQHDFKDGQGRQCIITVEDGSVFVNSAKVIIPNELVANGVVHVIDKYDVPSSSIPSLYYRRHPENIENMVCNRQHMLTSLNSVLNPDNAAISINPTPTAAKRKSSASSTMMMTSSMTSSISTTPTSSALKACSSGNADWSNWHGCALWWSSNALGKSVGDISTMEMKLPFPNSKHCGGINLCIYQP